MHPWKGDILRSWLPGREDQQAGFIFFPTIFRFTSQQNREQIAPVFYTNTNKKKGEIPHVQYNHTARPLRNIPERLPLHQPGKRHLSRTELLLCGILQQRRTTRPSPWVQTRKRKQYSDRQIRNASCHDARLRTPESPAKNHGLWYHTNKKGLPLTGRPFSYHPFHYTQKKRSSNKGASFSSSLPSYTGKKSNTSYTFLQQKIRVTTWLNVKIKL